MDDAAHAIIMAFSIIVFVICLSVAMQMFNKASETADTLVFYEDETNYYDNIELEEGQSNRQVDVDSVIHTLYRYYKENFCVKIYDAPTGDDYYGDLLHVFDINLEGESRQSSAISNSKANQKQKAYKNLYGNSSSPLYLFEAPWIGSTDEDMKTRIDYYINGSSGYINNTYVNYENNKFYKIRNYNVGKPEEQRVYFTENFIRYTYTGETIVTDQGDILVEGAQPKDKIVIIYTATKYIN